MHNSRIKGVLCFNLKQDNSSNLVTLIAQKCANEKLRRTQPSNELLPITFTCSAAAKGYWSSPVFHRFIYRSVMRGRLSFSHCPAPSPAVCWCSWRSLNQGLSRKTKIARLSHVPAQRGILLTQAFSKRKHCPCLLESDSKSVCRMSLAE